MVCEGKDCNIRGFPDGVSPKIGKYSIDDDTIPENMTEKDRIIQELGETDLLLPYQINTAFTANDRIKYYFTLIQEAVAYAGNPGLKVRNLITERELAGIDDPVYDEVITGTIRDGEKRYLIPHFPKILEDISECLRQMAEPFCPDSPCSHPEYLERIHQLLGILPDADIPVTIQQIHAITSADRAGPDSIHLLVMDLHKELNQIHEDVTTELIQGARCFLIKPEDRDYVRSFMSGLNKTAPLRFDHPGLGTTVTRAGEFLIIQNDIGLTDAHVLVIKIKNLTVHVIYTDVHMNRLSFFQSLLKPYPVSWNDIVSRSAPEMMDEESFHLSTGTFSARSGEDLMQFLSWLGSRIVFLIDWNKARKSLKNFILNKDAITVLSKAADREAGHRAYILLGGERLIYEALEGATEIPLRYGEPLHQRMGKEKSINFFVWVMETTAQGLQKNLSPLLIRDTIRAELLRCFQSTKETLIDICIEHACYIREVAGAFLSLTGTPDVCPVKRADLSKQAKEWERKGDEKLSAVRLLSRRSSSAGIFIPVLNAADDAIDALEEACYLYSLMTADDLDHGLQETLHQLAASTLKSCEEYLRSVIVVKRIITGNNPENMQDFLNSADEVIRMEEECDGIFRKIQQEIFTEKKPSSLLLYVISQNIEESTNALMKTVFVIREDLLDTMMG